MNGRLRHVEVWSDYACAGGVRLSVLAAVSSVTEHRTLAGDDSLAVRIPPQVPGAEALQGRCVLRIVDDEDDWDEWRVATAQVARGAAAETALECVGVQRELTDSVVVRRVDGDGSEVKQFEALGLTLTQHIESFVLPSLAAAGQAWWALGTIDSDVVLGGFVYDWSSPMEALRRMVSDAAALSGLKLELAVTRNGTSGYLLNVVEEIGSAFPVVDVRLGKNYQGGSRRLDTDNQATWLYGKGAEHEGVATDIAAAVFTVVNIDAVAKRVTLADPWEGPGPIRFDGQLNDHLMLLPDGSTITIDDSFAATQQLFLSAGTAGVSINDRVSFLSPAGRKLDVLSNPAQAAIYGRKVAVLDRPDIAPTHNIVRNAAARIWNVGETMPAQWDRVAGVESITKNVNPVYTRFGGQSVLVQTTTAGQGVRTLPVAVVPTDSQPYFSGYAVLWVVSGRVRVELVVDAGATQIIRPSGTDKVAHTGDQLGQWLDIGIANVDLLKLLGNFASLRIVQDGSTPAQFYVDAAQITQTIGQRPFLDGNGANLLWHAVNRQLELHGPPTVTVAPDIVDVARAAPELFPYDAIGVGGRVAVTDDELNVRVETRIVGYTRSLVERLTTKLDLSNLPTDLTDALARPTRPPPMPRRPDSGAELTLQAFWTEEQDGNLIVQLAPQPEDAVVYYLLLDEDDPVPPMGDEDWLLYAGPRSVTPSAVVIKLVAYAQIGERRSSVQTWLIDANRAANLLSVSSVSVSATQFRLTWEPDIDTARVDVYRVKNGAGLGYPTTDGSADPTKLVASNRIATMGVNPLSASEFPIGTQVMGGVSVTESGYTNGDVAGWALVPFDRQGRPGTVTFHKNTHAGSVGPGLSSFAFDSLIEGSPNQGVVSWVPNSAVTSAHKLRFSEKVSGLTFENSTITNPLVGSPRTMEMVFSHSSAKNAPFLVSRWRIELMDAGNNVLATYTTNGLGDTVEEVF